jgi:hypothetical protein
LQDRDNNSADALMVMPVPAFGRSMTPGPSIRLRAERKAGQLLTKAAESGERERKGGDRKSKSTGAILIPSSKT